MVEEDKEEKGWWKKEYWYLFPVILLFIYASVYYLSRPNTTTTYVSGIKVVSEIPLENLASPKYNYIALYNTTETNSELTCKFGLSAISQPNIKGYRIVITEGDTGIYLGQKEAQIKGRNQEELLDACHTFMCMREEIDCPEFSKLRWFALNAETMSIILDKEAGMDGGRGYAELVGVLSYIQSKLVDTNKDGFMEQKEIDANKFFIFPFIMENGSCTPQPFHNLVENWTGGNDSFDCNELDPAIMIKISDEKSIKIDGRRIILSGDDKTLHDESVILRDAIAPDWIRRVYGFK